MPYQFFKIIRYLIVLLFHQDPPVEFLQVFVKYLEIKRLWNLKKMATFLRKEFDIQRRFLPGNPL